MSRERERFDEIGKKLKTEIDAESSLNMGRRHMLGPPGSLNTITPCAAFFGASNVSKMLMEVPAPQRADAANSLVYEANVRLRDPVYGCMGAISALQQQVQTLQAELNAVRAEILRYRYREAANSIIASTNAALAVSVAELPQAPPTPTPSPPAPVPPPPTPPPPPSVVVSSTSSTPLYTSTSSAASYSSISNNHIPYFD
ncbi:LOB domain-containing protein 15 [Sesamum angolense]|uniref:LOB domain-containing protein 15 n=1 Tax=Sesamum angolense TaxID=2727404 RepID=A0AAE2C3G2_9LAMI|nr:LOB domain-containing protein 15 [Sesamum angolense]